MAYNYKYIPASMGIIPKAGNTPKNVYTELFQETLDEQFYNSSNWWTIQEETSVGSKTYEDVDVRIAHVINTETGLKLGDDWKTLLFKNISHPVDLGKLYIFDDNTWLTINIEYIKNLSATCTIRRCNNTLRWIDEETGAYYEEPCALEYMVKEPRDYFTQGSAFTIPGGFVHIEAQFNNRTNLIQENQRFLFGNPAHWTCYKVIGTGINDFRNTKTYDHTSTRVLSLDMIANFVNNELDDVVNGIADVYTNLYSVTLDKYSAQGYAGSTIQLRDTVTYNGYTVDRDMEWETSDASIATVSGSGLVSLITTGSCIITTSIESSSSSLMYNYTSASCLITVSASPAVNTDVIISPDTNYILEGSNRTYSVYMYENDIVQADPFTITCNGSAVPSANYVFLQTDTNHFKITNILRNMESYLIITCNAGSGISRDYNVYLRGGW